MPGSLDLRQLWLVPEEALTREFGELPPLEETETPAGCRVTLAGDGEETVAWLFEGWSRIYYLEAVGESGAVDSLLRQIMAGVEFK